MCVTDYIKEPNNAVEGNQSLFDQTAPGSLKLLAFTLLSFVSVLGPEDSIRHTLRDLEQFRSRLVDTEDNIEQEFCLIPSPKPHDN